jgi:hypothetical protein
VATEDPFTAEDSANKWTVRQGFHSSKGLLHEIFSSGLFRKKYSLLLFVVTLYSNVRYVSIWMFFNTNIVKPVN